jgi:hypothetical protein
LSTFAALALLIGLITFPAIAAPLVQGGNLLQNPSFASAASGDWKWGFWSFQNEVLSDKKNPDLNQSFYAPTFVSTNDEPQWDKEGQDNAAGKVTNRPYAKFRGGFYQTVSVAAGSRVRFSIWGNGYCQTSGGESCPVLLRAGIDPNGGANWQSGSIQWGGDIQVSSNDPKKYQQLTAPEVTVGAGGQVTVFTWGEPIYPALKSSAYFDEASLVVTAAPAAAPTSAAPTAPPAPPPAPAPCAQLRFVSDVTIPDNAPVAPGAQFVKTWRVQNSGTCPWSGTLNFIGKGNPMGGQSPTSFPRVEVGQTADLSINLTSPTQPGSYLGTWQARASDGTVLENLVVKITVTGEAATPVVVVTATPETPAAPPTPSIGQICILAFNDRNGDGQQDTDENLLAGVVFALSDASGPKDSYTADGVSEPYCFANLQPGSYQVTMKPPTNYSATTPKTSVVALSGGEQDVTFGARRGGPAPASTRASGDAGTTASGVLGNVGKVVLIVVAVLVLIGLGFGGGFVLMSRR